MRATPFPGTVPLFDPEDCPFIHDNIEVLYEVEPCPIEDLPTKCWCGHDLTYADEVYFVSVLDPEDTSPIVVEEEDGCQAGDRRQE